ncbi:galactoside 2-alpha-L-fucosyltransferase SEC1-like [Cloeon dipterum]|uniref:galactoside 2-alpha-L-fucosyltransferase SEC1-like n=1 Tax=Cloeon dipterum TaxID=197152 RepID=UPI0032204CA3
MSAKSSVFAVLIFFSVLYLLDVKFVTQEFRPKVNQTTNSSTIKNYQCPEGPIVAVLGAGRLGNQIWDYASTWSVARRLNRTAYVQDSIILGLSKMFENLSLKPLSDFQKCRQPLPPAVPLDKLFPMETLGRRFRARNLLLPAFSQLLEVVFPDRELLRRELKFKPELVAEVQKTIEEVAGRGKIVVGIHVRRDDFGTFLPLTFHSQLATEHYFKNAMEWYRQQYGSSTFFLIVSDDLGWCKRLLGNDSKLASKTPSHDLILLSMCDHTIIDYGTFGFWGAFFSRGHTVSLNVEQNVTSVMSAKANWTLFDKETLSVIG